MQNTTLIPGATSLTQQHAQGDASPSGAQALLQLWVSQGLTTDQAQAKLLALLSTASGRAEYVHLVALMAQLDRTDANHTADLLQALATHAWQAGEGLDAVAVRAALRDVLSDESQVEQVVQAWRAQFDWREASLAEAGLSEYDAILQPGDVMAHLAQAPAATGAQVVATDAGTAAAATTGAEAAAGVAAAGAMSSGALLAILGGVALAAGGGGGGSPAAPDTTAPAKITLSLASDTGVSATDGITSSAELTKTGLESGAKLEYSLDGGTSWSTTFSPDEGENTVLVRQTDAAGNVSEVSDALSFTLDTSAPVTGNVLMAVDRDPQTNPEGPTVTLNFGEVIDAGDLTDDAILSAYKDAFTVTTQIWDTAIGKSVATVNPVTKVAISDDGRLVLTLSSAFQAGQVNLTYQKPTSTAVLEDLAGNDVAGFFSGVVADGYIRGAQVWIDTDGDGVKDYNTGVVSNATGQFFLTLEDASKGALVLVGGVNIDTGVPNTIALKAPKVEDFSKPLVINPLTTLVQSVLEQDQPAEGGTKLTAAQAAANVAKALNLGEGVDLLATDPLSQIEALKGDDSVAGKDAAASALAAQKVAAQIAVAVSLASANDDSTVADATSAAVVKNLAKTVASGTVQASVADALSTALTEAAKEDESLAAKVQTTEFQEAVTQASNAIVLAETLDAVSLEQGRALDTDAPFAPVVSIKPLTNDATPEITLILNTTDLTGKAVVANDEVTVFVKKEGAQAPDEVMIGVGEAEIVTGKLITSLSGELADGTYTVTASIKDRAGNTGALADAVSFTVDTTQPTVVAVTSDVTSLGANDTAVLTFEFDEAVAAFSADAVAVENGKVESVERISDIIYEAVVVPDTGFDGQILVTLKDAVVKDLAGNNAVVPSALAIAVDTLAPVKPTLSLLTDTNVGDDGITSVATLNVSKADDEQDDLTLEYSIDGGEWSAQAPSADGTYTVAVRQTDASDNVSEASDPLTFTLDTTKPNALGVALVNDTGSSKTDSVTSDAELSVTGQETGAKLEYSLDAREWSTTEPTAKEGQNTVYVRQMDVAGNLGDSVEFTYQWDKTPPSVTTQVTSAVDDVNETPGQLATLKSGSLTNDATPTLHGKVDRVLSADERVQILDGEVVLGEATVAEDLTWSFETADLAIGIGNGDHDFYAQVVDTAGNTGPLSTAFKLNVNASVPAVKSTIQYAQDSAGEIQGQILTSQADKISDDSNLVLSGFLDQALANDEKLKVFDGASSYLGDATVDGLAWTFKTSALTEGTHSFTTVVENTGGSRGVRSDAFVVEIDVTAPALPQWGQVGDDYFDTAKPAPIELSGLEAGVVPVLAKPSDSERGFDLLVEGVDYQVATGTAAGAFTLTVLKELADGDYGVLAMDKAGNISLPTDAEGDFAFVIDTLAPEAPVIAELAGSLGGNQALTKSSSPSITLSIQSSDWSDVATIKVVNGGGEVLGIQNLNAPEYFDGVFASNTPLSLADGEYRVQLIDKAGNVTTAASGSAGAFTVDATAPTLNSIVYSVADTNLGDAYSPTDGDWVRLSFSEPVGISQSALGAGLRLTALNGSATQMASEYRLTVIDSSQFNGDWSVAKDTWFDKAGNAVAAQKVDLQANATAAPKVESVYSELSEAVSVDVDYNNAVVLPDGQGTLYQVFLYTDQDALDQQSVVWAKPDGSGGTDFLRMDLPLGTFTVDFQDKDGPLLLQSLHLTNTPLSMGTPVSELTQSNTDAVSVYAFTVAELLNAITSANGGALDWSDRKPIATYDKADLGGSTASDDLDKFVVNAYGSASALGLFSPAATVVIAGEYPADGLPSSHFLVQATDGTTLKSVSHAGDLVDMAVRDHSNGESAIFVVLSDGNEQAFILDPVAGQFVAIDKATFDAAQASTDDAVPANVGSSAADTLTAAVDGEALYGMGGNDILTGGEGNDVLYGGLGADTIQLGGGSDVLKYASVAESSGRYIDTVTGFGADDSIDLSSLMSGFETSKVVTFANDDPPLVLIENVRLNNAKTAVIADIVVSDAQSLFSTDGEVKLPFMYFEFDNSKATLAFSDKYYDPDSDAILSYTPIEILPQAVDDVSVPLSYVGDAPLSDVEPGSKLFQVTLTPKPGFSVDDIQVKMTDAVISADDVNGAIFEVKPALPAAYSLAGPIVEQNTEGAVNGQLTFGIELGSVLNVGDNELRYIHDSDTNVLKVQFDTDPSVNNTTLSEILEINGIATLPTLEQFVL